MADNFENLGFSVKIDGADSAVSHLDAIVQRLERIRELNGNVGNIGGAGNRRQTATVDQLSGGNATEIEKLSEIEKYKQRVAKQTELVTNAEYAEVRAKEMLNQALRNQISYSSIISNEKLREATVAEQLARIQSENAIQSQLLASSDYQSALATREKNKYLQQQITLEARLKAERAALDSGEYERIRKMQLENNEIKRNIDLRLKQEAGIKKATKSFGSYYFKLTAIIMLVRRFTRFVTGAVKESSNYIESLNLFAVAFGETYEQQLDWALDMAEAYGLASEEVVKFAGTFRELASSLGLVGETADIVTKTVTSLGYDLAALFNTTVEEAMEKLQSGVFSGNVRPLRAFGIDISQTQIDALIESNEVLKSLGISAKAMTQADKTIARLIITLQSANDSFGTMAREINNLQSLFRIFSGSLSNLKLALGDVMRDSLTGIVTYANAFIIALTKIIRAFAPITTKDETPKIVNNITSAAEEANEEIDELNDKLAGFDKFNTLQQGNDSTLSVTEALNQLLQEQVSIYDNELAVALENITNKSTELADSFIETLGGLHEIKEMIEPAFNAVEYAIKEASPAISKITRELLPVFIDIFLWLTDIGNDTLPIILNLIEELLPVIKRINDMIRLSFETTARGEDNIAVIIKMITNIFSVLEPVLDLLYDISWIVSVIANGFVWLVSAVLTPVVAIFEVILKVVETITEVLHSLFTWDWDGLGDKLAGIWKNWDIKEYVKQLGATSIVPKFADGGYSNANLIMTHENGKREWVGKAAGSSAIVNDTQMSEIMEMAVAKGVYNALNARSAMGTADTSNETIVVKIGEEAVFNAVRKTAKRQGRDFAMV